MPKNSTDIESSIGKLISAIQKEWSQYAGEPTPQKLAEEVMDAAHELLQARGTEQIRAVLGIQSVGEFLGEAWIRDHPNVKPQVTDVEDQLKL